MKRIETPRLILRNFKESDIHDYYEMLSNPSVSIPNGSVPLNNINEANNQINYLVKAKKNYAVVLKTENKVIGCIGLNKDALEDINTRNLGFVLNEKYWNHGYMSEALEKVIEIAHEYTDRLSMIFSNENRKSERLAEKLGFRFIRTIEKKQKTEDRSTQSEPYYVLELSRDNL